MFLCVIICISVYIIHLRICEHIEKERLARLHEAEHAQWLGTQQHELQQIKMKQAIAKEQKKLNLQLKDGGVPLTNDNTEAAMDKPDLETGVKPSAKSPVPVADGLELLKMEAGVNATNGGGKNIPTDLLKGLIVFVDGLILPDMDVLKNSLGNANVSDEADDMYRVALGLYDSKGKNITRLNASEWLPIAPTTVTSNAPEQVFCLKQSASRKLKKFDPSVLKSGSKALVEIQTKNSSSATVTQNSLGWGIIPIFTEWSGDRENKGEPKPLYLNSGLWRAALRKGIPDGSKELTSKADGVINGWILFRVCDASDSSYANTWSLLNTITSIGSVIPTAAVAKSVYVDPYGIDGLEASKAVEESPTPVRNTTGTPRLKRVPSISRVSTQGSSGGTRSGSRSSELTESRLKERADKFATPPRSEEGNSVTSLSSQSKALVFARKLQDSAAAQAKAKLQKISEKSPRLEEENDADEDKGVASDSDSSSSSGGDDDGLHDSNARNKQIPWQLGKPSGPCTEKYQRGDGIDVYIDGAMFLPDNCTTSRVVAKVYSSESEQIGESYVAYADPSSPATSPLYNFKIELRSAGFDVTSTVVVRIDSIDSTTLESSAVCYSCFKLFATRERVQPKQMNEANIFINTGAFQLPAKGNRLSKAQDKFDDTILNKLPRVPCASLLVRVLSAPKGSGGLGVLSREDHPKDEWGKLGLDVPMPVYSTGMYDGQLCEPTALEKVGFVAKMVGPTQTVDAALQSAINAARGCVENTTASGNVTKFPPRPTGVNASDHEKLAKWIKSLYAPADKIRTLLDYTYAVPYSADSGLSIAVDGLIHMQDISGMFSSSINMYKVIYSICPPSVFYMNPPLTNENVRFTRQNDLDCPIKMAKFTDGYSSFSPPLIASESGATGGGNGSADSLWLVLDVRTIKIDPPKAKFPKDEPVITIEAATDLDVNSKIKPGSNAIKSYWTILPLFKEKIPGQGYRYVSTGNFILPLIEGSVPGDILSAPDPFKETLSRLGGHKATVATTVGTASGKNTPVRISPDGSSVLIRVANPQITQLQAKLGKEELEPAAMNRTVMNKMLNAENLATGAIKHNLYVWESAKYAKSKLLTDLLAVYDAKKVLKTVNKLFAEATSIM